MFTSIARGALRSLTTTALLGMFLVTTGCGDQITYARKSNEEGMHLYTEKMYSDAAGAFRNAIKQDPRDYHSHFYLGVCYEEMKQYQQSFQEYYTTLEVMTKTQEGKDDDTFRLQALDTLASAIARNDDRDTELNKLATRTRISQKAEDWFLLAKVFRLRGDADSAIDCYRAAAHWDSSSFPIRKEFGLYLLDPLNQTKDAEYYLRQAYRLEPNDDAVNAALDRLGVTPLPAYKAKEEASRPIRPKGSAATVVTPSASGRTLPPPPMSTNATVQTPRD